MLNPYYLQELRHLRDIARAFSKENPAIAPMLEEPSSDPDVERLLEGVAFLTGAIRQKLDDEIPEVIHDLLRQVWPQALRPLPSATLIAFSPEKQLSETCRIEAGIQINSLPVSGTACPFRTCQALDLHPLSIRMVTAEDPPGGRPLIRISFRLHNRPVSRFRPSRLRLHLGGRYAEAADLYRLLTRNLNHIRLRAKGDTAACVLGPECLTPGGFSPREALLPRPSNAFDGYRLIQEFFLMPEKFLCVDITGWDAWTTSQTGGDFHLEFVIDKPDGAFIPSDPGSFVLGVVPAVNLFARHADPVLADHRKSDYPVRPSGEPSGHYQVFSIESVSGAMHGTAKPVTFTPFHSFSAGNGACVYHENLKKNPVRDAMDVSVTLAYAPDLDLSRLKSLSFDILCTNGTLPEALGDGDICAPSPSTPEFVTARNIRKPTTAALPALGNESLWTLTSLLTLNHLSLGHPDHLKALLRLFVAEGRRDRTSRRINQRRIDGIRGLTATPGERLIRGAMFRGVDIRLTVSLSHFAGLGDVWLFGTLLDRFFGMYAPINTFTRLTVTDNDTGEAFTWPERMGDQPLI